MSPHLGGGTAATSADWPIENAPIFNPTLERKTRTEANAVARQLIRAQHGRLVALAGCRDVNLEDTRPARIAQEFFATRPQRRAVAPALQSRPAMTSPARGRAPARRLDLPPPQCSKPRRPAARSRKPPSRLRGETKCESSTTPGMPTLTARGGCASRLCRPAQSTRWHLRRRAGRVV